jgi:2-polyprenyl-6-methoxyphenol hydroxylase-like FAD-dependent oxidoreductase
MRDVAIVGGGPNGLMLAGELCLGGVRPIVLEQRASPSTEPKANGLAGQILTVMDYRGLYGPLAAVASAPGGSRWRRLLTRSLASRAPVPTSRFTFGGFTLDLRKLANNPLSVLPVSQRHLEAVLEERARALGAQIRRGHTVTGLCQDPDGVTVDVDAAEGPYQIRTRYLVGCDGGHSTVRHLAGIGFPGVTSDNLVSRNAHVVLPRTLLSRGQLRLASGERFAPFAFHRTPRGAFSFASLQPGIHVVSSYEWDQRVDDDVPMTVAELRDSLSRVVGQDIAMSAPPQPGHYVLRRNTSRNTRLADRYRLGRVFLAGDAAHVHFGLGGPGLNLGLTDVVNLGWKLAAEIGGRAPASLLDTYHTERHPFAERVNHQTQFQAMLLSPGKGVDVVRQEFGDFLATEQNLRHVAALIAGTDLSYDMGDEVPPHPLMGRLAPDLRLTTGHGATVRIAELMREARPLLIDLTHDHALGPGSRVDVVSARCRDRPDLAGLLLRPDGYVAWASDHGDPAMLHQGIHLALSRFAIM